MWRQRQVNLIRIASLAIGLASGLIIFLVVNYMFSYDRHHPYLERSFWIVTDIKKENVRPTDAAPRPLAEVLRRNYPFVQSATRIETVFGRTINVPAANKGYIKKFNESRNVCFAEPQYFDHFSVEWVMGNPQTALTLPNSIVISERYAQKYFDQALPIGRVLRYDNRVDLTVTGVIKNPPSNTQLRYDALISYATIPGLESAAAMQDWEGLHSMCFVLLRKGASQQQLVSTLDVVRKKYLSKGMAAQRSFNVLPLADLNHERSGMAPRPVLYILITIGLLLVLGACFNYINLATAQALQRAREVGVRKVVGSSQLQLIRQFLIETVLITCISVIMALILTQLFMPGVNHILAAQVEMLYPAISILDLVQPKTMGWFVILIAGVILFAGLYPAWVLSKFNPVEVLTGQLKTKSTVGFSVRKTLITGQFILAQLFLIIVLTITAQLRHMNKVDWGFQHQKMLSVWLSKSDPVNYSQLRQRWLQTAGVESVTFGSDPPASPYNRPSPFSYHIASKPESFETRTRAVDEHYLSTFGLSLVAGRNFISTDTSSQEVMVNETLVRQLGITGANAVIGKHIRVKDADRIIVAVVKDFRSGNLHQSIVPVTLIHDPQHTTMAILKLSSEPQQSTLDAVQQVWDETFPDSVYKADQLDDLLKSFFQLENLLAGFTQAFAFIAMAMSCIGLYGLVTFMAQGHAKEIGVRRVLGARTQQLLWMFGKEFGKIILAGFLIAAPLGLWLASSWLQQYAHRISINVWLPTLALVIILLITILTTLGHALKAATTNPVRYLRSE